jgi:pimeloyl-ACP methyl ester carboxylesterase
MSKNTMPAARDTAPRPFQLAVPQATLDDLRDRLRRTRWTDDYEGTGWGFGADLGYLRALAAHWLDGYDWRAREARLNQRPWFTATIDGQEIRFIHQRGKGPRPMPLILFHGWPDSIHRYLEVLPLLTDPAAHGGRAEDAFDVVVPALVGFPGKRAAPSPHLLRDIAELSWRLMTEKLGYTRFAAAGGDGGSPLSQLLGVHHADSIVGLHLTDLGFQAGRAQYPDLSPEEQQYLAALNGNFEESAYALQMGTRPQTLAYGLNDSPVGMAAWIVEKIRRWSDCDGDLEKLYTKDELLDNIMQYWLAGPSVRPFSYREEWVSGSLPPGQRVPVPAALGIPPRDFGPIPPRSFAARTLVDLRRYTVLAQGGHFVAMEFPELYADDLRAFFRELR